MPLDEAPTTPSAALTATAASKALPPACQHFESGIGGEMLRTCDRRLARRLRRFRNRDGREREAERRSPTRDSDEASCLDLLLAHQQCVFGEQRARATRDLWVDDRYIQPGTRPRTVVRRNGRHIPCTGSNRSRRCLPALIALFGQTGSQTSQLTQSSLISRAIRALTHGPPRSIRNAAGAATSAVPDQSGYFRPRRTRSRRRSAPPRRARAARLQRRR